jgi:RNA polymerase sigma-70 factor (ECF subfamily)
METPAAQARIVSAVAATAEPAWEEVYASLRAFIGRRVRNPADVDDLVQRVLLQLVKGLGSLRDAERLHAWVYRTARNVIIDHYRSSSVRREIASGDAEDIGDTSARQATDLPAEDEGAALRELAACMAPMLLRLAPSYREAITLTELEGHNQAEAARRAGVSVSGMKSRVQRGRRQLRAALEACCRIELDRRGGVVTFGSRTGGGSDPCGGCQ